MTSRETYLEVVRTVDDWPLWTHHAVELVSEGGLLLLMGTLCVIVLRDPSVRHATTAALCVAATGIAYAASALVKTAEAQPRPCQAIDGIRTIAACPPAGDWSLPSNHATIAAGLAVGVALVAPRLAAPALLTGLSVGASRVMLGVHYPHDVVTGLSLGAAIVALSIFLLRPASIRLVRRFLRRDPRSRVGSLSTHRD